MRGEDRRRRDLIAYPVRQGVRKARELLPLGREVQSSLHRHFCLSELLERLYMTLMLIFIAFNQEQIKDITSSFHSKVGQADAQKTQNVRACA